MILKTGHFERFGVLFTYLVFEIFIVLNIFIKGGISEAKAVEPLNSTLMSKETKSSTSSEAVAAEAEVSPTSSNETAQNITFDEGSKNMANITKVDENLVETSNKTQKNRTNSNYIIEYKPQVFDSPEDIKTQQEWGGNCTLAHWDTCKALESWFGNYEDPKDGEIKNYLIDCKLEPVVCLRNSWTVTRCNLLCMSRCNREISFKYDKYVSHSGECKAHAHG